MTFIVIYYHTDIYRIELNIHTKHKLEKSTSLSLVLPLNVIFITTVNTILFAVSKQCTVFDIKAIYPSILYLNNHYFLKMSNLVEQILILCL